MSVFVYAGCVQAEEISSKLVKAPSIILQSQKLAIRILPSRAWTFDEIKFDNHVLTTQASQSGLVLNFGGGEFLGSGHTEAGKEIVQSIELIVDGKPVNAFSGGTIVGDSIELIKQSTLAATKLKSVIRLNNGKLECEQFLTATKDEPMNFLYAFMFPWKTETTQWMAKTTADKIREGDFTSGDRAWELRDNVQWTSIYNPVAKATAVTIYEADSQAGAGVKHGYWNVHKAYHKEYYQPIAKTTLVKDKTYHWQVKVLFVPASEDGWKEAVKQAVGK